MRLLPQGYGALPPPDDPVAATAQRINSLRQAGMLEEQAALAEGGGGGGPRRNGDFAVEPSGGSQVSGPGAAGHQVAGLLAGNWRAAWPGNAAAPTAGPPLPAAPPWQTSKPSLHDLLARKSAGPKKLTEVRVNPAIASTFGGAAKLAPPPGAASSPAKLALPPASLPAAPAAPPVRAAAPGSPTSPAALAALLSVPAPAPAPASSAPHSPSGGGSPWAASSPAAGSFGEFASPGKAAGSPAGTISLTASAVHTGSPQALPAYLFAEPTAPPGYGAAAQWGSHVAGEAPKPAGDAAGAPAAASPADELFADFSPFK